MASMMTYTEEEFGILTDDDLYLDCVLIKPAKLADEALKTLRVWVPKNPLTKTSTITCARREVDSYGADATIAHLVFDLRGTGYSDGNPDDTNFQMDLYAIASWAKERFGRINFGFLGTPSSEYGRVNLWPLREGTVMESYHYPAPGNFTSPRSVLYLSTYGNFNTTDDAICATLADAGYDVYGLDPLRYLLHASASHTLTPEDLWADMNLLIQMLPSTPIIIGQPLAGGLAIMWTAGVQEVRGAVIVGRAQLGLRPSHIFQNRNPYNFLLHRYTPKITPRPLAYIQNKAHPMGGDDDEIATLYQNSKDPRRLENVDKLSVRHLQDMLEWVDSNYISLL
jgi:hypothetical protein